MHAKLNFTTLVKFDYSLNRGPKRLCTSPTILSACPEQQKRDKKNFKYVIFNFSRTHMSEVDSETAKLYELNKF